MILSFKEQFVEPILKGTKIHTIREDASDRWHEGRIIHFDTNVRTPDQYRFKEDVCKGVQEISFDYKDEKLVVPIIRIDGKRLGHLDAMFLAQNDGFKSVHDLINWFDSDFKGKIIHWTDFRY